MAQSRKTYVPIIALVGVVLIAAFLRIYGISARTEFLGDQGRTGIHIYEAWEKRELPLVGPTVLSGQHLGPAFYYIMAPAFILTGFNPVGPAVFTALIGIGAVGLLWWLGKELFGWRIATMLAALWATSPQIVSSDQVLWEPNIIPFFILLYLTALYKRWGVAVGLVLGILVQLHYPNLLFIGLTLLFYMSQKRYQALMGATVGFLVAVSPFLSYELRHGFADVAGVLRNFLSNGEPIMKRQILANILDYGGRVIRRVAPVPAGWEWGALILLLMPVWFKPKFWKTLVALWFVLGVMAISVYRGVVFDHYLFFLLPAVFLLFGFLLERLNKKLAILVVSILVFFHLSKIDIFEPGHKDVIRTRAVAQEIIRRTGNEPFSFALIASRSFSDLHYRYFFLINKAHPEPILSEGYQNLFLVCETNACPPLDDPAQIICYDDYCSGNYPKISLSLWKFVAVSDITGARLYQYQRAL